MPKPKAKPKPKLPKKPTQKQRFIAAAKAAEVDETGEAFEKAFRKIVLRRLKG